MKPGQRDMDDYENVCLLATAASRAREVKRLYEAALDGRSEFGDPEWVDYCIYLHSALHDLLASCDRVVRAQAVIRGALTERRKP